MQPSASASARGPAPTYAGIALIALATLMLEVLLTRIISVVGWYDLAFFVINRKVAPSSRAMRERVAEGSRGDGDGLTRRRG